MRLDALYILLDFCDSSETSLESTKELIQSAKTKRVLENSPRTRRHHLPFKKWIQLAFELREDSVRSLISRRSWN